TCHGMADLLFRVVGREEVAEASCPLFYRGVEDWLDVDSVLEQPIGKLQREQRTSGDDRDNRRAVAGASVESPSLGEFQEQLGVLRQPLDALRMPLKLLKRRQSGRRVGRGHPHTVNKSRCRVAEVLDNLFPRGDVPATT